MSNPSRALTSCLDWRQVFEALELGQPRYSDLPQVFECPLCETGVLTLMNDHVLHAHWGHCISCGFAGDVIELATRVFNCSVEHALDYMESKALFETPLTDDDVAIYKTQHIEYRQRIRTFWEDARRAPSEHAKIGVNGRLLLRRYCMADHIYHEVWNERAGQLFGVARRKTIEELFAPSSFEIQERVNRNERSTTRRGGGPGRRRIFSGPGWNEVLVIAHSDLPGRIIGFTFLGGDVDAPRPVFKRINLGCCASSPRESGFGFLDAQNGEPHPEHGRNMFMFLDADITTLLHARHLRERSRPLPVLLVKATRDFQPLHLPPLLDDRRLIFCGPLTETLPLAKAHDGMVSTYAIPELEVDHNLKHREPIFLLHQFQKSAIHWFTALEQLLPELPRPQVELLLQRLQLSGRESERLQQGLSGLAGERFADLNPHRLRGKQAIVGSYSIEESSEGWIARKAGVEQLICHLPLRVEAVYRHESDAVAYGIAVRREKDTIRLLVTQRDLNRSNLFEIVSRELQNRFNQHLEFVRHKWANLSMSLALQFSNPEIIPFSERVGWNPLRMRFQFPQFAILNDGQIDPTPMPTLHPNCDVPGSELVPPSPYRQAVTMLSRSTSEAQIIWALAACVSHNLLAGNCTRTPVGVLLDGTFAHETGVRAASALGCGSVHTFERGKEPVLRYLSKECGRHDFPSVVHFGTNSRHEITTAWIDAPQLQQAILPLPTCTAVTMGLNERFVRIRSHEFPLPLGPLASAAKWIIPSYLEDVCRRKKQIEFKPNQNQIISVLHDIAEWFERCGGDSRSVLAGEKLLVFDFLSPAMAFVELVESLRSRGDIASVNEQSAEPIRSRKPVAIVEPTAIRCSGELIRIRPCTINDVLRRKRAPAIRIGDIQADLESLAAWRGAIDDEDHGSTWLIDFDWWSHTVNAIRRKLPRSATKPGMVPIDGPDKRKVSFASTTVLGDSEP